MPPSIGAQYVAIGTKPPVSIRATESATIMPQKATLPLCFRLPERF